MSADVIIGIILKFFPILVQAITSIISAVKGSHSLVVTQDHHDQIDQALADCKSSIVACLS